jgi:hypothetical protein
MFLAILFRPAKLRSQRVGTGCKGRLFGGAHASPAVGNFKCTMFDASSHLIPIGRAVSVGAAADAAEEALAE